MQDAILILTSLRRNSLSLYLSINIRTSTHINNAALHLVKDVEYVGNLVSTQP